MKSKAKTKNEVKQPIVLIGTQNKKNSNLVFALIVKLLFTYMISAGTIMCFTAFYNIPYELSTMIQQVLLYVTAFFPVFVIVKKRYLIPGILIFALICYYFLHETINEAVLLFKDHILIAIDGRLLTTMQYVPQDSFAFLTKTQDYLSGMNISMMLISGIICLLSVLFTYKRFRGIAIVVMWLILYAPAFVAEKADYTPYLFLIIPAFFGLYAISSANLVEEQRLLEKNRRAKKIKKTKQSKSAIETAMTELSKHGKNCLCGILAGLIALSTFFMTQSWFPGMSSFDVEDAVRNVTDFFSDMGSFFGSIFSGEQSTPFNNYFSSDNFFMSNNIELKAPPSTSENPVLKITSDSPNRFFLVGDVGVDFTGSSWLSVMKKEKNGELSHDGYNISEDFNPDLLFQVYIANIISPHIGADYIGEFVSFSATDGNFASRYLENYYSAATENQSIYDILRKISNYSHLDIEYIQNTDVVFKPYIPGNTSYVSNGNFSVYADSVIRISDKKNWMKNFETDVISPYNTLWFASKTSKRYSETNSLNPLYSIGFTNKQASTYHTDKKEYDRYIKDNYLSVPDSEKENMKRLLSQFETSYEISPSYIESNYLYAFALCEYLKQNYKYSLTANNSSDGENTVLGKFLFETKEGHCALYASSMVLALREHGIPARYVSGFSTGELTLNEKSGFYEKTITEKDLHAWVEVYIPECGWMAFDPTGQGDGSAPGGDGPVHPVTTPPATTSPRPITTPPVSSTTPQTTTPPQSSADDNSDNSENGSSQNPGDSDNGLFLTIILTSITVIAFAAAIYGFIASVKNKNEGRWKRFKSEDCTKAAKEMHQFIMKLFATTDIAPHLSELPTEFAVRIDGLMNISDKRNNLQQIMRIIEKAEFSAKGINEEERKCVYVYTKMLYNLVMNSAGKFKKLYLKIVL